MSFRDSFELTDPGVMRAMAHPTRLGIIHVFIDGPATATECSEVVGESPPRAPITCERSRNSVSWRR